MPHFLQRGSKLESVCEREIKTGLRFWGGFFCFFGLLIRFLQTALEMVYRAACIAVFGFYRHLEEQRRIKKHMHGVTRPFRPRWLPLLISSNKYAVCHPIPPLTFSHTHRAHTGCHSHKTQGPD